MGLNSFLLGVAEDNLDLTLFFIQSKRIQLDYTDLLGRSALHYAAANGNVQMVRLLIQAGIDPNSKNNAGETPLMKACQFIELSTIDFLMGLPQVDIFCVDTVPSPHQNHKSAASMLQTLSSMAVMNTPKKEKLQATLQAFAARMDSAGLGSIIKPSSCEAKSEMLEELLENKRA